MKVLIATDGSSFSKAAVEFCGREVLRKGSEVLIVSSFEDTYPLAMEPVVVSSEYYQMLRDSLVELTTNNLKQAVRTVRSMFDEADVSIAYEVLCGAADRRIIEKAKDWGADLIVVGSHGSGFWGRLLGSVSTGVVHHAPCSVLVVRPPASSEEE